MRVERHPQITQITNWSWDLGLWTLFCRSDIVAKSGQETNPKTKTQDLPSSAKSGNLWISLLLLNHILLRTLEQPSAISGSGRAEPPSLRSAALSPVSL
jgi:hypothetical protein